MILEASGCVAWCFLYAKIEGGGGLMARRKPKPTAVKKLEGNPGKRKMNTKKQEMPACLEWFMPEAKRVLITVI